MTIISRLWRIVQGLLNYSKTFWLVVCWSALIFENTLIDHYILYCISSIKRFNRDWFIGGYSYKAVLVFFLIVSKRNALHYRSSKTPYQQIKQGSWNTTGKLGGFKNRHIVAQDKNSFWWIEEDMIIDWFFAFISD